MLIEASWSQTHGFDVVGISTITSKFFSRRYFFSFCFCARSLSLSSELSVTKSKEWHGKCIREAMYRPLERKKNNKKYTKVGRSHTFTYFTNTAAMCGRNQATIYTPYPKIISCTSQLEVKYLTEYEESCRF